MVPIIIGFLASVIGLGGIGQKIREIIEKLQKPVNKAIDFVIKTGLKLAGPIIRGIKGISGKVKAKVAAGKAWVKGKAEAGKKWVKGKVSGRGKPKTHEEDIQDRWAKGMAAVRQISARSSSGGMATADLHGALAEVKTTYGFQEIRATRQGTGWGVYAKLNPDNADRLVPISGKTLLVGEGNLTFTESNIILGRVVPGDVTATVYEKKEQKAPTTQARGERLQDQGVTVEYGVDATKLHEGAEAKPKFDTIVWMFPHPGGERAAGRRRGSAAPGGLLRECSHSAQPGRKDHGDTS